MVERLESASGFAISNVSPGVKNSMVSLILSTSDFDLSTLSRPGATK